MADEVKMAGFTSIQVPTHGPWKMTLETHYLNGQSFSRSWIEQRPILQPMTMIDRVGRAIEAAGCLHCEQHIGFVDMNVVPGEVLARAAIEAMREPTTEMYDALSATNRMWRDLNSTVVWQTMLDGALKS